MSGRQKQTQVKAESVKKIPTPVAGLFTQEDFRDGFKVQTEDATTELLPILALFCGTFALIFKVFPDHFI